MITEVAIFWLREKDYFVQFHQADEGRLSHLFFALPAKIMKLRSFYDVKFLDCTYKTNSHGVIVINLCSVTGNKKTVLFALSFTAKKKEEDMIRILQRLIKLLEF